MGTPLVESVELSDSWQVTIPPDIREVLGVRDGDRLVIVATESGVQLVNPAVYAMSVLQEELTGVAEDTGLDSDEAIDALIADMRR